MSYKPNLTSSLPVLAWIATLNPVTFLAGVAIDQVIKSQVVSEFKFELTGNVAEPNFRQVDRKTKEVSVGRSRPPEIVDSPKKKSETDNKKPMHLQQYPKINEREKVQQQALDTSAMTTFDVGIYQKELFQEAIYHG